MKVGLFFGSFNPMHMGHLLLARYWLNETDLQQIWFVVSPQNPHKAAESLASIEHRLAMARLSVAEEPACQVSDVELHLPLPSYTIQTLHFLRSAYPQMRWVILLGADTAASLPTWREGERLLREWSIWVYPRRGTSWEDIPEGPFMRKFPEAPRIDLSANQIRAYIGAGKSIRYLVPPAVERYIYEKRLYAS
ncbi:MAG: nicotinate (nicotinamide) nucleotide adenylyltransferase [Bacteroidia bacterium]|nr:nicotinate (nicotinamide) nucleotide adenylyltransferase [Bacteroidia bacterium]